MLALFDVDGTLVHVAEEPSFAEAFAETCGFLPDMEWERYRHSTDSGIVREILESRFGREPTDAEVAGVLSRFVGRLERNTLAGVTPLATTPGAAAFVASLAADGCRVALATGCVEASARFKVARAGLSLLLREGAFSDAIADRADILREAARGQRPETVVYFGDRPWDVRASRAAGVGFLGINVSAEGRRALAEAGAG
ncbi:MAG: HAD family hydrolase, partial [Planctomycetota bacterium]